VSKVEKKKSLEWSEMIGSSKSKSENGVKGRRQLWPHLCTGEAYESEGRGRSENRKKLKLILVRYAKRL